MNFNNKILPVALVAALLGGTVGAFVTRPSSKAADTQVAGVTATKSLNTVSPAESAHTAALDASETPNKNQDELASLTDEQEAYRAGFSEGIKAAKEEGLAAAPTRTRAVPQTRVVYRNRARASRGSSANRVYYNYEQPRKRSFWSKHRDKLTVAAGAGGGAIIGGLLGGKKGAAIGALAGGGGSALYTYKLRKRNRRY
ncbi:MAG TPA: hypothetical protein VGV38_19475 [Pyrinomonadaceae bacterium]|nr:hypothetical protein [Pyrinomonadaceae bacterium]